MRTSPSLGLKLSHSVASASRAEQATLAIASKELAKRCYGAGLGTGVNPVVALILMKRVPVAGLLSATVIRS